MPGRSDKQILTTGEAALICHVAPRTVAKWFDSGRLRGYRIPGSRQRRIPRQQLLAFLRAHNMPLEAMEDGRRRVLIVDGEGGRGELARLGQALAAERYEVRLAASGFEAGAAAQQFRPHAIVLKFDGDGKEASAICRNIRQTAGLQSARVIAAPGRSGWRQAGHGFDGLLSPPYTLRQLVGAVEDATGPVH